MTVELIKLNIETPIEPIPPGRGFYQLEEETLFVQIGAFSNQRRFYSFLESEKVSLDFDRMGRLIFAEICLARRNWTVSHNLRIPRIAEPADIRWLNFRDNIKEPAIVTTPDKNILSIRFSNDKPSGNYYLADTVILQVNGNMSPVALWIDGVHDDLAGIAMAAFRKKIRGEPLLQTPPITASVNS